MYFLNFSNKTIMFMYVLFSTNWSQRFLSAGLAPQSNLGTGLTRPWFSIHLRARLRRLSSAPAGRLVPPPPRCPLLFPAALLTPALRPVIDVGHIRPARYRRRLLTREGQIFRTAVVSALLVLSSLVGSAAWLALAGSTLGPPIVAVVVILDGTPSVPDDFAGKFDAAIPLAVEMSLVGTATPRIAWQVLCVHYRGFVRLVGVEYVYIP